MARKYNFGISTEEQQADPVQEDRRPLANRPKRAGVAAPSVNLLARSLQLASEDNTAEALREQLLKGQAIIELDPKVIEPSFVADRIPDADEIEPLVGSIRDRGQQSPILVRAHPEREGVYQIAFGHRRWRAADILGIPVKAVVRDLSDEDLIIAQGKENSDRTDLSFIEKARFASELLTHGYKRELIMHALSVPRQTLSYYLSIISKIPADIILAIGPAPSQGRRPWQLLADLMSGEENQQLARAALQEARVTHPDMNSDARFETARKAITLKRTRGSSFHWTSRAGETVAAIADGPSHYTIKINKGVADGFGDYLVKNFETIWKDFKAQK